MGLECSSTLIYLRLSLINLGIIVTLIFTFGFIMYEQFLYFEIIHVSYIDRMSTGAERITRTLTQIVTPPPLTLAEEMLQTPRMMISDLLGANDVR